MSFRRRLELFTFFTSVAAVSMVTPQSQTFAATVTTGDLDKGQDIYVGDLVIDQDDDGSTTDYITVVMGGLIKEGSGSVDLNNEVNLDDADLTINGGRLILEDDVLITEGYVFQKQSNVGGEIYLLSGDLQIDSDSSLSMHYVGSANNPYPMLLNIEGGVLDLSGNCDDCITGGGITLSGSSNIETDSAASLGVVISDGSSTGRLVKTGDGSLELDASNTYSGGTDLESGTIIDGNSSAFGTGLISLEDGSTLSFSIDSLTLTNSLDVSGTANVDVPNSSQTDTISGVISDGGSPGLLTKTGAGTLALTGANTFSGGLDIEQGTISLGGTGIVLNQNGVPVNISSGGTLDLSARGGTSNSVSVGTLNGQGSIILGENDALYLMNPNGLYSGNVSTTDPTPVGSGDTADVFYIDGGVERLENVDWSGDGHVQARAISGAKLILQNDILNLTEALNSSLEIGNGNTLVKQLEINDIDTSTSAPLSSLAIEDGSTLEFMAGSDDSNPTRSTVVPDFFSGSGKIEVENDAEVFLDFRNTPNSELSNCDYTGEIVIEKGGEFVLGSDSSGSFESASIQDDGVFAVAPTSDVSVSPSPEITIVGALNGDGTLVVGFRTVDVTGINNLTGINSTQTFSTYGISDISLFVEFGELKGGVDNLGNGSIEIVDGILDVNEDSNKELSNKIADASSTYGSDYSGRLYKDGAGVVTLSGENTYAGGTTINAGGLSAANNSAFGTGSITLGDGTELSFSNDALSLSNDLILNGSPIVNVSNGLGETLSGVISDGTTKGKLEKTGSGTLNLLGTNTYSGGSEIAEGDISIGNASALGTGAIEMDAGTEIIFGSGAITLSNGISLTGDPTFEVDGSQVDTISGVIGDGSEPGDLVKTGSGKLILSGSNTFSGGMKINAGIMGYEANSAFGTGSIEMAAGTEIDFDEDELTLSNPISLDGDPTISVADGDTDTISGVIGDGSSPGDLVKTGNGILDLTAANTYSGTTDVQAGTLELSGGGSISETSDVTLESGSVLDLTNASFVDPSTNKSYSGTQINNIEGSGEIINSSNGYVVLTNPSGSFSGSVVATDPGTGGIELEGANTSKIFSNSNIQGGIEIDGTGINTDLNNSNISEGVNVTGGNTVTIDGTVDVGSITGGDDSNFYNLKMDAGSKLNITGSVQGAYNYVTLDPESAENSLLSIAGSSSSAVFVLDNDLKSQIDISSNSVIFLNSASNQVTISGNIEDNGELEFDRDYDKIRITGNISGSGGIIMLSPGGKVILSGDDTFAGAVNIFYGETLIDGTLSDSQQPIYVESQGVIGGIGNLEDNSVVSINGEISPGDDGAGTFSLGSLRLLGQSIVSFDLGEPGVEGGAYNDLIKLSGDLALGGTLNVNADPASGSQLPEGVYSLYDYSGKLSGSQKLGKVPLATGDAAAIQTVIPGKVNLVVYGTQTNIWNGSATQDPAGNLTAGSGTWNISNSNWTDLGVQVDHAWNVGEDAIFEGTSGTVTVDDSSGQVTVGSMDFENTDGNTYTITGGALQASGSTLAVKVGSSGKAEIDSVIQDASGQSTDLVKTGDGTLTLAGVNNYTGKTEVQEGVLDVYLGNSTLSNSSAVDIDKSGTLSLLYPTKSYPAAEFDVKSLDGSGAVTTNASDNSVLVLKDAGGNYSGNASTSIDVASGTETFGGGTIDGLESSTNANIVISAKGEQDIVNNKSFYIQDGLELDGTLNIEGTGNYGDVIVNGEVKGSGGLNISAASGAESLLSLNGERSYTGLTTIGSDSALMLEDMNSQMTGNMSSSKIIDNGVLYFASRPDINDIQTLSAPISGDGAIEVYNDKLFITGGNTLTATSDNSKLVGNIFEGSSIAAIGSSIITSSNGLGQGNVALYDNSNLDVSQNYDALISNTIFDSGSEDGSVSKDGTGDVTLNGLNTYGGGTTINEGGLTAGNNSAFGSGAITMADGTELSYASDGLSLSNIFQLNGKSSINVQSDQSDSLTGVIGDGSSSGTLVKTGSGILSLLGVNTYTGGTDIASGSVAINGPSSLGTGSVEMDEGTSLSFLSDGINLTNNITLSGDPTFDVQSGNSDTISGVISNGYEAGDLVKTGSGTLKLMGNNTYTGTTEVAAGTLNVDGDSSGATGQVSVDSGAALGGTGTIGGSVDIAEGATLAAGGAGHVGTLTIDGGLTLESGSTTDFTLGQAGTEGGSQNDLIKVGGDLTLGGTIDVTADPTSGTTLSEGVYRLFDYSGALSGSTALSSTLPINAGDEASLQTSIDGQVNLVVFNGSQLFWNGSGKGNGVLSGGSGTWNETSNPWTDSAANAQTNWIDGRSAIFEGQAGNIVVDDSEGNISVGSMQFANTDGGTYDVTGDAISASGSSLNVDVGDGSSSGADIKAEIAASITDGAKGPAGLIKSGQGTLVMDGSNTYSGGTQIESGVLEITNSAALGTGAVDDQTSLLVDVTGKSELANDISGSGSLTKTGSGDIVLSGKDTLSGGINVQEGTLAIGVNASPIDSDVNISSGASLDTSSGDVGTKSISGAGTVNLGAKSLTLSDASGQFSGQITGDGSLDVLSGSEGLIGVQANQATVQIENAASVDTGNGSTVGSILDNGGIISVAGNTTLGTLNGTGSVSLTGQNSELEIDGKGGVFSGAIEGSGVVKLDDGASETLGGNNAVTGEIDIGKEASLTIADGSTHSATLPSANTIQDDGSLTVENKEPGHVTTIKAAINGSGAINVVGGETVLTGQNGFTGGVKVSDATLEASTSNLGKGSVELDAGSLLNIDQSTDNGLTNTISGEGKVVKRGVGNVTVTGENDYSGGTEIKSGSLIGSAGSFGSGAIEDDSQLTVSQKEDGVMDNSITGTGSVTKTGDADLTLSGQNDFSGGLNVAAGTLTASSESLGSGNITDDSDIELSQDQDGQISDNISGSGVVQKTGSGTLTLSGTDSHSGGTEVAAGTLNVDGDSSGATGQVSVDSGASLGGTGTIGGSVDIAGGATLAAGDAGQVGTLTIDGGLTLESGSTTDFDLGQAGTEGGAQNDLIKVGGDLTLGGTIDVNADPTSGTTLSEGVYRLFDYAGTLSGEASINGSLPIAAGDAAALQTSVNGQVNLVVANMSTEIWNGSIDTPPSGTLTGGDGVWKGGVTNWTNIDADVSGVWNPGSTAIFEAQAGRVSIDDKSGNVSVGAMDFANSDGQSYIISGDTLYAAGQSLKVNVGDGATSGSSITAEIDSSISDANVVGGSKLVKDGLGTLVLGGDNTLTDGIDIEGGSLDITNAKSTGKGVITDNAALNIDLAGDGQIGNDITGAGTVRKSGSNTVVLSGENNYSGGTDIEAGTLKGSVGNFGSGAITDNATLDIDQSSDASLANKISGTGDVIKDGAGDLTLSGVNSYSGSTVIKSGVLTASVGSMGSGEIVDDATLNVDQNVTGVLSNELSGNGTLIKSGDGVLQLTGANSLSGEIDIQSGTLELDTKSSGQAEIEDQATFALNQADDGILGNAISGSGGIVKEGAGSVTLAGNNSFTGGIDIEAGDITTGVNNLGTGKVLDNATLTLSQSKDGELKNVISGKGKVVKAGSNTLTLTSQNTWTGGTDIQSGTLSGNTSSFGSGSIEDDASLEVTANGDSTFSNTVSGSGDVEYNITGEDTLNVTSINSYSGGTDIEGGTVKGDAGSFGSGQIVDNGTLEIDQTYNSSMANNISGSGELVKDGAGDLTLTGTNTYSGGTDIEAGTLTAGTQNLGTGDITNNATLDLKQDYNGTLSGQISGAGTVIKEGIGDVTLQDTNTYTGGTDVVAGTLTGTITSFGTGKIIVAEGAKVNIDQKDDPVMSNNISGAGVIEKSDTGTVIMSGKDTHTGGTIVTGGTLVTDASNLAGGNVVNNAKLVINQSSSATLASQITGSGSLVKEGSGTLDITGDTSGMTGTTKVLGGTLNVETNASNSDVTTVSGSTLAGQGSVGDTTIQNGATLSPAGNSIGTLHVAGNLVLENGSEMVSTTDGKATDLVDVKGNAIVSGAAEMFTNSSQNKNLPYGQTFTILHANGGVTGRFGSFTTNLESAYPFLTPGLTYTSNDVDVSLVRDTEVPFSSFAQTRNQKAVAASLDETSLNNSIVQQIEQQSAPQARQSYDSLSGEIRASVKTDLIQDTQLIRNAAFNRMASAECDMSVGNISTADPKSGQKMQGGACDTGMVLWGEGFGDHGHNGGSGGSADMKHSAAGFIMGLDAPINNTNIRVGGLVSYSHDRFSVKDGRSSSGSANNLTVGGYASTHWERLMLRAGATYTWNMVNTNRNVSVGSIHERDSGHSLGGTAQAFAELGYRFDVGDYAVEPFGQIAYVNQDFMGSREHGGSAALKTHGADTGVTFATFGARASHTFRLKGIDLNAFGSASYRHAFGGLTPTARQVYAGGTDMDVAGTPLAANSAVVEAGVSYKVGKNIDVGLSYTGQFGQKYRDNAINGHVRVQW